MSRNLPWGKNGQLVIAKFKIHGIESYDFVIVYNMLEITAVRLFDFEFVATP